MTVGKEPAAEAQRRTEQVALAAFVSYSLLAGGNAVCIRFSNRELAPLWGAGLRFALAAALLLLVMAVLRLPIPRGRALAGAVLYGVLTFGGAFALAYYALVRMNAGFGQIVLALVPLATLILAVLWRQEGWRRRCESRSHRRHWSRPLAACCASHKEPYSCVGSRQCTRWRSTPSA